MCGDMMLLMKDIIQEGNPILRKRSVEVPLPISDKDFNTLQEMMDYVRNSQNHDFVEEFNLRPSVGLAAPQIGISKKMFCMHTVDENGELLHSYAVVNPKIISHSEGQTYLSGGEGCLSVNEEKNGFVPRFQKIKAKAHLIDLETREGHDIVIKLSSYPGIVFQHEYDHLMGILFVDKVQDSLSDLKPVVFKEEEPTAE